MEYNSLIQNDILDSAFIDAVLERSLELNVNTSHFYLFSLTCKRFSNLSHLLPTILDYTLSKREKLFWVMSKSQINENKHVTCRTVSVVNFRKSCYEMFLLMREAVPFIFHLLTEEFYTIRVNGRTRGSISFAFMAVGNSQSSYHSLICTSFGNSVTIVNNIRIKNANSIQGRLTTNYYFQLQLPVPMFEFDTYDAHNSLHVNNWVFETEPWYKKGFSDMAVKFVSTFLDFEDSPKFLRNIYLHQHCLILEVFFSDACEFIPHCFRHVSTLSTALDLPICLPQSIGPYPMNFSLKKQ